MSSVRERLPELSLVLPEPRPPAGSSSRAIVDNGVLYTSGLVAIEASDVAYRGAVGEDLSPEDGRLSARGACLQSLGMTAAEVGLDRVERVIRTTGCMRAAGSFGDLPTVMDGASDC
jgi:enamine deaminase RidA (YjgF/YER057c/UK114 family)